MDSTSATQLEEVLSSNNPIHVEIRKRYTYEVDTHNQLHWALHQWNTACHEVAQELRNADPDKPSEELIQTVNAIYGCMIPLERGV